MSGPVDAARLCHAVVRRLDAGEEVDGTPWVEDVPFPADSPEAASWRERELSRPVDPATGPGRREVLLRYAGGPADLVTVARRDGEPAELAAALGRIDDAEPPDWGLGDRHAGDATARHEFVIADSRATEASVLAALGLMLARYTGTDTVTVGTADPTRSVQLPADPSGTVETYLATVRRAWHAAAPAAGPATPPLAGLAMTGAAEISRHAAAMEITPCNTSTGEAPWQPATAHNRTTIRSGNPEIPDLTAAKAKSPAPGSDGTGGVSAGMAPAGAAAGTGTVTLRPFLAPVQPLSLHLAGVGGPILHGTCWYRRRYFDPRIVEQFARHLATAHRALVDAAPDTPVGELPLLDAPELRRIAELGGLGRDAPRPEHELIHRAVAAQAARTPHAVAVSCEGTALTYAELDARANRAAHALRAAGAGPGTRVGVCLDRSLDLVVALLAVLKAGAAYVPMDPAYPAQRLAFTAEDAGLLAVVAENGVPELGIPTFAISALTSDDLPAGGPPPGDGDAEHAYVIYTSGSTGTPKGVVVPHRNVMSLLAATRDDFALGERDVWTQFHSVAFDFSVWEIWGCLATGGRLVLVPYWVSRSPDEFAALLRADKVTVLCQTPSAFAQLREADGERPLPESLRLVIFGGEPLDTGPLLSWFDRHPESRCRLVNMYGITETTVHVTAQTVTRAEALARSRSVGRPLPGWHVAVLDGAGRPLPPGVAGEIHVGGAGVAAGYLSRPELTAQRFRTDAGGRWYRSGDRGRLLPDGRLEHLGRLDSQVQLRGFRIELDEVRARLLTAPGVTAAAVTLRQRDGDAATAALAAYVVLSSNNGNGADNRSGTRNGTGTGNGIEEVRSHLARFLPEHMIPATVTALPALPLTPNGKVDTARLPEPLPVSQPASQPVSLDSDPLQDRVVAAWGSVFGFRVRPDDDFFALGGNSLLAVRLAAALQDAGLPKISVRQLYGNRTAARVTALLAEAQPA